MIVNKKNFCAWQPHSTSKTSFNTAQPIQNKHILACNFLKMGGGSTDFFYALNCGKMKLSNGSKFRSWTVYAIWFFIVSWVGWAMQHMWVKQGLESNQNHQSENLILWKGILTKALFLVSVFSKFGVFIIFPKISEVLYFFPYGMLKVEFSGLQLIYVTHFSVFNPCPQMRFLSGFFQIH